MNTAKLIDATEVFALEKKINQMAGQFIQEESQVIYVDFKSKTVIRTVTTSNHTGETQETEEEESGWLVMF